MLASCIPGVGATTIALLLKYAWRSTPIVLEEEHAHTRTVSPCTQRCGKMSGQSRHPLQGLKKNVTQYSSRLQAGSAVVEGFELPTRIRSAGAAGFEPPNGNPRERSPPIALIKEDITGPRFFEHNSPTSSEGTSNAQLVPHPLQLSSEEEKELEDEAQAHTAPQIRAVTRVRRTHQRR